MWRGPALWFCAALLVRALTAAAVTHPGYIDAYYSFHVAANLLEGRGLVEDVLWNYLSPPLSLPRPSNAYWPPGGALFAAAGGLALPETWPLWRRMQGAPVLGAALVVARAYVVARHAPAEAEERPSGTRLAGTRRPASPPPEDRLSAVRRANAVAGLTLFSGIYFPYWVTTDVFTPYALVGGGALWLAVTAAQPRGPGSRPYVTTPEARNSVASVEPQRHYAGPAGGHAWLLLASGLLAGLAQGIRADGLLLLVAPLTAAVAAGRQRRGALLPGVALTLAGGLAGSFPLLLRTWLTYGTLAPPGVGGALWLREYDDLFLYAETLTMERWRAAGIDAALSLRVGSLPAGLAVLGHPLLYYAVPLTLLGLWRTRRAIATWIPLAYVMALYALMTLVFPLQGVRGGLFHSLIAALPWLYGWTVQGLETVVARGARRRGWPERQAQAVFCAALVAFGALASVYFAGQLTGRWNRRLAAYGAAATWLDARTQGDGRVMAVDPPGFWYVSRRSTVMTPSDGPAALTAAAVALDVDYVLVEPAAPAYLAPVYRGEQAAPDLHIVAVIGPIQIYRVAPAVPGLARQGTTGAVSSPGRAARSSAAVFPSPG